MLKYSKQFKGESESFDITYEEALKTVLGTYRDCDITRDMLTIVNTINTRYSWVYVSEVDDYGIEMCLMPGLFNFTPEGVRYDDDGNRIPDTTRPAQKGGSNAGTRNH